MSKVLFSFGLITDTHVRPATGDDSSPFPVNERANARARYAAQLLARQAPVFTVHMGDMVHTLPHMPQYDDACKEALQILAPLQPSLHFMAGNHDVGDKPMPASPAAGVNAESNARYRRHFGDSYYSFEQNNCVFIVINSSLLNSETENEQQQQHWLQNELESNTGKRLFLFSHYPPFLYDRDEPEHYDNLAQPARDWLLELIGKHQVEAVFSGHVHHFFCNTLHPTDSAAGQPEERACQFYCLPPTSFTRQDYAEMFRTLPADEYGRDDKGKFSVAMVDVTAEGFTLRVIPTDGRELEHGETAPLPTDNHTSITPEDRHDFCVPLRHAWHEGIDLPFNGPMEEFSRKRCRNDYTLLRLMQLQIGHVRVPVQDLLDPQIRLRMRVYHRMGIRFHVFCLGLPDNHTIGLLGANADMIASLEMVNPSGDNAILGHASFPETAEALTKAVSAQTRTKQKFELTLSKAHSSANNAVMGKTFAHSVSNGFLWEERNKVFDWLQQFDTEKRITSITFQIPLEEDCGELINSMQSVMQDIGLTAIANVKFANSNPATANFDDKLISERANNAFDATARASHIRLQFDTFMDVDRGYAPRHGLIDRRCNLRQAGRDLLLTENLTG